MSRWAGKKRAGYPADPKITELLDPTRDAASAAYEASSAFLHQALTPGGEERYFLWSKSMIKTNTSGAIFIVDPWGNSYAYSTSGQGAACQLWSTKGSMRASDREKWIMAP